MLNPYIPFRCAFIMIESCDKRMIKPALISNLDTITRHLDLHKPDIFLECLTYLVRNKHIDYAKQFFSDRSRYMRLVHHFKVPIIELTIDCYEAYLSYLTWLEYIEKADSSLNEDDARIQVLFESQVANFETIFERSNFNHEFFLKCFLRMLYQNNCYDMAEKSILNFLANNKLNLSGYLMLYGHLFVCNQAKIEQDDGSLEEETLMDVEVMPESHLSSMVDDECLENDHFNTIWTGLRKLDPSNVLLLDLMTNARLDVITRITSLMDMLEYRQNFSNFRAWRTLIKEQEYLIENHQELRSCASNLWLDRYSVVWHQVDFLKHVDLDSNKADHLAELISRVTDLWENQILIDSR